MKLKRGQVALYLLMVIVAITILVLMDVGTYLSVTAKNRATHAGDAAALAVANLQGELLERMGALNVEHLRAAFSNDAERCEAIMLEQRQLCFLGPLEGIRVGNDWARKNGITETDKEAEEVLRQHVIDIRTGYAKDPEQYPEPWQGAWSAYATALETAISAGLYASPDSIDFIDMQGGHILLNARFYDAIAGRNWCWFHFHARGLLESYSGWTDFGPLPTADDKTRQRRCANSEIYSLYLEARSGSAMALFGKDEIRELTGLTDNPFKGASLLYDENQVWYFFDDTMWRRWWEIDPDPNEYNDGEGLPVMGKVRSEYDVRGAAAACRVSNHIPDVVTDSDGRTNYWTAAAKAFGLVLDERGELLHNAFVTAIPFDQTRLVPWDSVGGKDLDRPNLSMVQHIRRHLPRYLQNGPKFINGSCYYCRQLIDWEDSRLRETGRRWLKENSGNCRRNSHSGGMRGGTSHAH